MVNSNDLVLQNVIDLNVLTRYDVNIKSYIHTKITSSGRGGTISDDDIQTAITDIISELNK